MVPKAMLNAAKLKELRTQKGWTQQKLGQAVGYDGAYIRKLETGWTPNPGCQTLARLALALKVPADALLDFDAATQDLDLELHERSER
jgi:transcriptional regulator with XRE-family HTH domain